MGAWLIPVHTSIHSTTNQGGYVHFVRDGPWVGVLCMIPKKNRGFKMVAIDELDTILGGVSKGKTCPYLYGLMDEGLSTWTSARGIASF
ncbi:hypothetical protein [Rossellomorea sp. FM04394]|uniref:hypothetical protein n=1 Tax=Rossellomorea sp. FM04394 TaxID=3243076 RepID=UPI0035A5C2A7